MYVPVCMYAYFYPYVCLHVYLYVYACIVHVVSYYGASYTKFKEELSDKLHDVNVIKNRKLINKRQSDK